MTATNHLDTTIVLSLADAANECAKSIRNYLLVIAALSFVVLSNLGGTVESTFFHPKIVEETLIKLQPLIDSRQRITSAISKGKIPNGLLTRLEMFPKVYIRLLDIAICIALNESNELVDCDALKMNPQGLPKDVDPIGAYLYTTLGEFARAGNELTGDTTRLSVYPGLTFQFICTYPDIFLTEVVDPLRKATESAFKSNLDGLTEVTQVDGRSVFESFDHHNCFGVNIHDLIGNYEEKQPKWFEALDSLMYVTMFCIASGRCDIEETRDWIKNQSITYADVELPYIGTKIAWQAFFYLSPILIVMLMVLIRIQKTKIRRITTTLRDRKIVAPELLIHEAFGGGGSYADLGLRGKVFSWLREICVFGLVLVAIFSIIVCLMYFVSRSFVSAYLPLRIIGNIIANSAGIQLFPSWDWRYGLVRDAPIFIGIVVSILAFLIATSMTIGPMIYAIVSTLTRAAFILVLAIARLGLTVKRRSRRPMLLGSGALSAVRRWFLRPLGRG